MIGVVVEFSWVAVAFGAEWGMVPWGLFFAAEFLVVGPCFSRVEAMTRRGGC